MKKRIKKKFSKKTKFLKKKFKIKKVKKSRKAKKKEIPIEVINNEDFQTREDFDDEMVKVLSMFERILMARYLMM